MFSLSVNLFGQARNFKDVPKEIFEQLNEMGIDNMPLLNSYESVFFNVFFKSERKDFDFTNKKVGFYSNGKRSKIHYFDMQKKHFVDKKYPCDNGTLYIFDSAQKEESDGYDAAIVYWDKFLLSTKDVVKRLKRRTGK
jgi:hypothetical protein